MYSLPCFFYVTPYSRSVPSLVVFECLTPFPSVCRCSALLSLLRIVSLSFPFLLFQLFTEQYTSRVVMRRPKEVAVKAVNSRLFSSLDSTWRFRPGNSPNTTLIDFSVEFEVKNLLAAQAMDVFFDEVALQQVRDGGRKSERKRECRFLWNFLIRVSIRTLRLSDGIGAEQR